jgi:hypothetical protein
MYFSLLVSSGWLPNFFFFLKRSDKKEDCCIFDNLKQEVIFPDNTLFLKFYRRY